MSILSQTVRKVRAALGDVLVDVDHRSAIETAIFDAIREGLDAEIRFTRRETSIMLKDALQEGVRQLRASADTFEMFLETIKEPEEPNAREEAKCSHCERPLGKVSFVCELVYCDKKCEDDWHSRHDPDNPEDSRGYDD